MRDGQGRMSYAQQHLTGTIYLMSQDGISRVTQNDRIANIIAVPPSPGRESRPSSSGSVSHHLHSSSFGQRSQYRHSRQFSYIGRPFSPFSGEGKARMSVPFHNHVHHLRFKERIRHFTWTWFTMTVSQSSTHYIQLELTLL